MMRLSLASAALILIAPAAYAGCENYTDGSMDRPAPKVSLCLDGDCEETTLEHSCSNINATHYKYANGWTVSWEGQELSVFRAIEQPARLTCEVGENGPDGCFPNLSATKP